ncbi:hypothetical protein A5706_12440 [Mycobacterium sp. E796]|nr:hypothetical protein A5706_12440 [Mycobacterium sp. E796]
MSRPRPPALPREQRTAWGQVSQAVTLAQPISAAAIATNPLPVQRSRTRRPGMRAVWCIASTSNRESSWGRYTLCATEIAGSGYVVVNVGLSLSLTGIAVAITA